MKPITEIVGENVKRYRLAKGWPINQLSVYGFTNFNHVKNIEGGKQNVTINVLENLANALGVKVSDLVEEWSGEE